MLFVFHSFSFVVPYNVQGSQKFHWRLKKKRHLTNHTSLNKYHVHFCWSGRLKVICPRCKYMDFNKSDKNLNTWRWQWASSCCNLWYQEHGWINNSLVIQVGYDQLPIITHLWETVTPIKNPDKSSPFINTL